MEFAVNYVNKGFNEKYKFDKDIYIKYPGFKPSLEEFKNIPKLDNKLLLHGIIPSSGSIFDEHLCDDMEYWAKIFKENNNKWVSLHFYYEDKFCQLDKMEEICYNNIATIRKFLPGTPIIIENVPYQYGEHSFCFDPEVINYYCSKYDLGLLLDISHLCVYAENNNLDVDDYLSKLPLNKVREVHISGFYQDNIGKYIDSHFECFNKVYELYEKILNLTNTIEMTTLEYPVYNNMDVVNGYLDNITYEEIYNLQKSQLNKLKEIYKNVENNFIKKECYNEFYK